jgi:hypothetical protein
MRLSVTDPIGRAWNHMIAVLFQPFNLSRWFIMGFGAWLAGLGQGGGGFNFPTGGGDFDDSGFERVAHDITSDVGLFITIAVLVGVLVIGLTVLFLWLSSRGKFMLLYNVARNTPAIGEPWREYRREGNSLFQFHLLVVLSTFALFIGIAGMGLGIAAPAFLQGAFGPSAVLAIIYGIFGVIVAVVLLTVVLVLAEDFIVPIMYQRRVGVKQACAIFRDELLAGQLKPIVLYLLMRWVLSIAAGMAAALISVALTLFTCCVFLVAVLLSLGYIAAVAVLPIPVFMRAYSLAFIEQYGPQWRMMVQVEPRQPKPQAPDVVPTIPLDDE